MEIRGAAALVTGGASGLGWETAQQLSAAGARVTLVDLPTDTGIARAQEIDGVFAAADVTSAEDVRGAVRTAARDAPLRIVVNCAGIAPPAKVLDREGEPSDLDAFARLVNINLIGTYNVTSQAAAVISRTDPLDGGQRGVMINTSSVAAWDGQIGQAAYSASKGGVQAMTLPIARELARHGIRVCAIAPGIMETPMLRGLPEKAQSSLSAQVPFPRRLGRPAEYAALALTIIGNDYLNAETIRLDGALRMSAH